MPHWDCVAPRQLDPSVGPHSCSSWSGVLRGSGQQLVGSVINFICYYAVGVPALIWFTFKWHWGLEVSSAAPPNPCARVHVHAPLTPVAGCVSQRPCGGACMRAAA